MTGVEALKLERWYWVAWLLVTAWLLACALLIQGEYGDGYQTIVNARYFFGDSSVYYVQRGPLAAAALWPVEAIVKGFALDPVNVRPYHVFSGFVHAVYLVGCWLLLRRAPVGTGARLLAFAAAILCVVFYAYAPYLSHDLLPGLLFLLLIFLCHRWIERGHVADAAYLVLLGAAVTLIKQTYAIFWVALIAYAVLAMLLRLDNGRVTIRKLAVLMLLATTSALLSWLGYALFIAGDLPDVALFARPLRLLTAVSAQYGEDLSTLFASDLYFRNLPNYGIAAMLLVIPGLVLAFRGTDARVRQVAVCWLIAAGIMQFVDFREVRYLAFLAPLTAMLIAPVAQLLLDRRLTMVALIAIVLLDQVRGITVATEQITSTTSSNVQRFVNAPQGDGNVFASRVLSIVYHGASPLSRDRYHGIYHLTPQLLRGLYEGRLPVATIDDPRDLGLAGIESGDRVYYSNNTMIRRPPWHGDNLPVDMTNYLMVAGDARMIDLVLRNENYEREENDGSYIMYLPDAAVGQQMPTISSGSLPAHTAAALFGDVENRERLQVIGIVVKALCQADSCSYR